MRLAKRLRARIGMPRLAALAARQALGSRSRPSEVLTRGAANAVFGLDDGKHLIKVSLQDGQMRRFEQGAWAARAASDHGVTTPVVVALGRVLGAPYVIQERAAGAPMPLDFDAQLERAWTRVGAMNRRIESISTPGWGEDFLYAPAAPTQLAQQRLAALRAARARILEYGILKGHEWAQAEAMVASVASGDARGPVLLHGDVKPSNTLRDGQGALTIIDWDQAQGGMQAESLARMQARSAWLAHAPLFLRYREGYDLDRGAEQELLRQLRPRTLSFLLLRLQWMVRLGRFTAQHVANARPLLSELLSPG